MHSERNTCIRGQAIEALRCRAMSLGFRVLVLGGKGSGGCDLGLECIFMGGGYALRVRDSEATVPSGVYCSVWVWFPGFWIREFVEFKLRAQSKSAIEFTTF